MNRRAVDSDGRPGVDEKFSSRCAGAMSVLAVVVAALIALMMAAPSAPVSAIEAPEDTETTIGVPPPPEDPASPDTPEAPATTAPLVTRPPISANDFIPEDQDLTTCIGVLERPGCGSESRGGWHQRYVLVALLIGLVVVFGNVARGVRKRDS